MSRTLKLLVVVLFVTAIVGCGDKKSDDASSQVSSNNSGGSQGSSDEDFYKDSGSSGDESGGSSSNADEDFYKNSGSSTADEDFYKNSGSSTADEDFYKNSGSSTADEDFYKNSGSSTADEDFYKNSGSSTADEDFYKKSGSSTADEDFYKNSGSSTADEDFYKKSGSSTADEDFYKNSGGASGGSSDGPRRAKAAPKTYSDHARVAFEQGHDDLALKYTYAAILTDANAAKNQKLHFWVGPKAWDGVPVPTMAIRWGVGINYTAPKNLTSRPPMIGDKPAGQTEQGGPRRSRVIGRKYGDDSNSTDSGYSGDSGRSSTPDYGGGGSGEGGAFRLPSDSWGQLLYLTGDVGERFVERLDMRRTRNYYGAVLKDAPKVERKASSGDYSGGGAASSSTPSYDSTPTYTDDSSSGETYGGGGASSGQVGPQLIPGVTMLGVGNIKDLLTRAKQQNLDVVVVFDVEYSKLKNGVERNETVMRLYSVTEGRELRKSPTLNNVAVWLAREEMKDDKNDPVEVAIDSILSHFADEHVRAGDLPPLDAEKAKFRVRSLTEKRAAEPLPVLAEIKYFHTQGFLTDAELADAYKQVIGDAGLQLASGVFEEQKKVLANYLEAATIEAETPTSPAGPSTGGFR